MDHETRWNARYRAAGDDFLFGIEPNVFLARRAHLFQDGHSALSIADGEGRNSVWLAEQGLTVTAVEISPIAVAKARKLAGGRGVAVKFMVADLLAPDWPPAALENEFDWVVGIFIQFASANERPRQFAIEELVEYEDDIAEGSGHRGRSALIGMVARKPQPA